MYVRNDKRECSYTPHHTDTRKSIWQIEVSKIVKVFMWRACLNALPTKANLFKKKIVFDPVCPVCGLEEETMEHVLYMELRAQQHVRDFMGDAF